MTLSLPVSPFVAANGCEVLDGGGAGVKVEIVGKCLCLSKGPDLIGFWLPPPSPSGGIILDRMRLVPLLKPQEPRLGVKVATTSGSRLPSSITSLSFPLLSV